MNPLVALSSAALLAASISFADTPAPAAPATNAPATAATPVAAAPAQQAASMLSLNDIESRVKARGYTVKEMKVLDKVVKIEAHDTRGREFDLLIDRRSGETLYEKLDD